MFVFSLDRSVRLLTAITQYALYLYLCYNYACMQYTTIIIHMLFLTHPSWHHMQLLYKVIIIILNIRSSIDLM